MSSYPPPFSQILNKNILSDEQQLQIISSIKNVPECIDMLLRFENGDPIIHKDYILELQNTTRENYPSVLLAFFADVNKSASMIIKALVELNSNQKTKKILAPDLILSGHKAIILDNSVISIEAKQAVDDFMTLTNCHVATINEYLSSRSWITGLNIDELKQIKTFFSWQCRSNGNDKKTEAGGHPKFFHSTYKALLKKAYNTIPEDNVLVKSAFDFLLQKEYEKPLEMLYFSCNLYDLKIIPKKSVIFHCKNSSGTTHEIVYSDAGYVHKNEWGLNHTGEPNYSIEYYIKKHMIEVATGKPFFDFIGIVRDYLFKDYYKSAEDKNWNEKHPLIIESATSMEFEYELNAIEELYDLFVSELAKFQAKGTLFLAKEDWVNSFSSHGGRARNSALMIVSELELSIPCEEYFEAINRWASNSTSLLVEKYKKNDTFIKAKEEEIFVHTAIHSILQYFYEDRAQKDSISTNGLSLYRDRATFHTLMATSLFFDFRKDAQHKIGDIAKKYLTTSEDLKYLYEVLKDHPYHDLFEFDIDFLEDDSKIGARGLATFLDGVKRLNLPIRHKAGFKLRKLGNYRSSGIYFSHSRTLGVDFRHGLGSYIHEMAHHIDLNRNFRGRKEMVYHLWSYFNQRIDEKREYYLKSEELIARAAEVSMLLKASKYRSLSEHRANPETMIVKMRENFACSRESMLMDDWLMYEGSIHYVPIEASVRSKKFDLLDRIDRYFSVFWGWDSPTLLSEEQIASTTRGVQEKSIYGNSQYSFKFHMRDIYNLSYPQFDVQKFTKIASDFILAGIPKITLNYGGKDETVPVALTQEENINNIKRLWGVYVRSGESSVRVALCKIPILHLDKDSLEIIERDFSNKFKADAEYVRLLKSLHDLYSCLRKLGYS